MKIQTIPYKLQLICYRQRIIFRTSSTTLNGEPACVYQHCGRASYLQPPSWSHRLAPWRNITAAAVIASTKTQYKIAAPPERSSVKTPAMTPAAPAVPAAVMIVVTPGRSPITYAQRVDVAARPKPNAAPASANAVITAARDTDPIRHSCEGRNPEKQKLDTGFRPCDRLLR